MTAIGPQEEEQAHRLALYCSYTRCGLTVSLSVTPPEQPTAGNPGTWCKVYRSAARVKILDGLTARTSHGTGWLLVLAS